MGRRQFRAVLGFAAGLALVLRLIVIVASPGFAPRGDAVSYDRAAVSLATTGMFIKTCTCFIPEGGPSAFRPPGYPYLLSGAYIVTGKTRSRDRLTVARLTNALLSVATVELIAMLALLLWDRRVAAFAAIVAAVYPPFLMIDSTTLTESLFVPLEVGSIVAVLIHRRSPHRYRWAVLAGVLAGLASLTRGNGLLLLIPLVVGAISVTSQRTRAVAVRSAVILVAVALVVVTPWTIRNLAELHAFIPVTDETGYTLAGLYNESSYYRHMAWEVPLADLRAEIERRPRVDEAQWDSDLTGDAERFIEDHLTSVPKAGFWNTLRIFDLYDPGRDITISRTLGASHILASLAVYSTYPLVLLTVIGLALPVRRRVPGFVWIAVVLFLVSTTLSTVGGVRYRLPIDPVLLVLAAATAVELWRRYRSTRAPSLQ
jgi:4-amino-4-deoxy-L-arabinose transferase-like glycosyltransferase